ncbi:uncharacterized protein QC761_0018680 [Podospora bellae-mahoneyi]|uniref:Uncharacterized protein n=1 Tax=Podospora bellae-mahoneyi TaxID=2093777 RepID=A0ABR0G0C8_9PEZI|nr:hypothetical protein QC761_0018680 [Podospora bellae-mahoneyi]
MLKIAMKRKRDKSRSDFHRYPPRLSAQRQDLKKIRVQIIATLYTVAAQGHSRHLCRQIESKRLLTVGHRGYRSSTRVGSVAPLGNTKEDDYYRNDSLKYCRHEEKKKKKIEILADRSRIYTGGGVASARLQIL